MEDNFIKVNTDLRMIGSLCKGKTIKFMGIYNGGYGEHNKHIFILFTDNTYVIIGIANIEDGGYVFTNKYEHILTESGKKYFEENPLAFGYFDGKNFKIDSQYEDYTETGLIKIDYDKMQKAVQKRQQEIEDNEYKEYLRLKEKYEGDKRNVSES